MAMSNAFTTAKGVAAFPYLSTPDTKFNEEGEYKVNLILTKEDAQPVITQIDSIYDENVKEQKKKLGNKPCKEANRPYACLLYTSPSPRDVSSSRMPSSA